MSEINGIGAISNLVTNTSVLGKAKNKNTPSDDLSYHETSILNEIKEIMSRNFGDVDVRLDFGTLQPNGMTIEVTGFRKDNLEDVDSKSWYSLSVTTLKKMAEDENYKKEMLEKIMINVDEEHKFRGSKTSTGSRTTAHQEETQTETFINAEGEKILAIRTAFGVRYMKIGEVTDFLLSGNKTSVNMESMLEKTYGI